MKQTRIRSKDATQELAAYKISLSKKDQVEIWEEEGKKFLVINGTPAFFFVDGPVPTLKYLQERPDLLKRITVDMGAIKFVIKGADIMRPGITQIDPDIQRDEFVVIVDEQNKKPIAIGKALLKSTEMQQASSGKVIKNLHYVGDEIWRLDGK